jgi:4-amino-4-deoxy-L-arabinose transferase-like glycosyltransferase
VRVPPLGVLIAIASALLYLAFALPQLGRPLMYDDANFALGIQAAADTGVPFGNQGWMSDRGDFSQREQWALWHPPLYIYADALFVKLAGWTPPVMRLLGVLGALATAALTFFLARDLTRAPPQAKSIAGGSAVALTLLSPLAVQSTLVIDIDFAILLPLMLLFTWLYLRWHATPWRWLTLAPLFAVLLWAKMTNPLPLIGIILVWELLRGQPLRAIVHALAIGLGGAALFAITWVGIGSVLHFPLEMPFLVNQVQWADSADVARRAYTSPGAFIDALQPTVLWLGPGLVALGLSGIAVRIAQLAYAWQVRKADFVIGVFAALVLGYVNKSAGWFPKYEVAMAPLLACLAAPLIAQAWCLRPRLSLALTGGLAIVSAGLTYAQVSDRWALERTWRIDDQPALLLFGMVFAALLAALPWRAAPASGLAALFALGLGWSIALDAHQVAAPYQTDYWYGTTGMQQATAWIDQNLQPGELYVASKEVAIVSRDTRYVDQDNLVYLGSTGRRWDGTWAGEQVQALVTWQREPYIADLFERQLADLPFAEKARFGDYVVYEYELTDGS